MKTKTHTQKHTKYTIINTKITKTSEPLKKKRNNTKKRTDAKKNNNVTATHFI